MSLKSFILAFSALISSALIGSSFAQEQRPAKIGILWHAGSVEEEAIYLGATREGFRDLGYIEGKNLELVNTFANEEYDRFNANAADLVAQKVDIIVAVTSPAVLAAQRATTTIPVVFVIVPDPVRIKAVGSLARPGANITGLSSMNLELDAKRVELLKSAVPNISRVAVFVNPNREDVARRTIEDMRAAAARLGMEIKPVEVRKPADLDPAFSALAYEQIDGVIIGGDPMLYNERRQVADLALQGGYPASTINMQMAEAGALMSYGPDFLAMFRRVAVYVDKILKGAEPAELPVEQPTELDLVINLKTAKALGITVPDALLARADEVIE